MKNQYIGLRYFYQFNDEVGDLLHEHDQPSWLLVVGGVGPDETDHVVQGWDAFLQLLDCTVRLKILARGGYKPCTSEKLILP